MCAFFSCVVFRDGSVRFCEDGGHETIITRLGLRDDDLFLRHWVRVEQQPAGDGWAPLRVDETSTPTWFDEERPALEAAVLAVAVRVRSALAAYDAATEPAWAVYDAAVQAARAAYDTAEQAAWRPAQAAYDAAVRPAWAAYDAAEQAAQAAYIHALSSIDGYVPATTGG